MAYLSHKKAIEVTVVAAKNLPGLDKSGEWMQGNIIRTKYSAERLWLKYHVCKFRLLRILF